MTDNRLLKIAFSQIWKQYSGDITPIFEDIPGFEQNILTVKCQTLKIDFDVLLELAKLN